MAPENLPPPTLITNAAGLKLLADVLYHEEIVAVDTESNSLYAYREQVCLIQFSTTQADYLVDPLAVRDLSRLAPLFADAKIEKVFHAAEYDVLCLRRDFGFEFANLFDTMVAARILGREAVGLGNILEAEFGVKLDKRYQRADWGQRPLPAHLLGYARLDTHYLIPLRNRLRAELRQNDLWPLALEDFERMSALKTANGNGEAAAEEKELDCWRVSGVYDLEAQQVAVLQELCRYRDQVARRINRPLFKVIGDQTLAAIAASTPRHLDELRQLPGMSDGQVRRHGVHLLQAVQRGLKAPPLHPQRTQRPDERFSDRLEMLRQWRKSTGEQMGVQSDVILPRDLLYALAEQNPQHRQDLEHILGDVPWRLEHFGEQILSLLNRRSKL